MESICTFLFDCKLLKDDIAMSDKSYSSSILQVKSLLESTFCTSKKALYYLLHTDKVSAQSFLRMRKQSVPCLPSGGKGLETRLVVRLLFIT